jgi:phosphoribosylanthranilate isomerase
MLVSCAINVNFQNSLVTEKDTKTEDYVLIESMKQKKIQKTGQKIGWNLLAILMRERERERERESLIFKVTKSVVDI